MESNLTQVANTGHRRTLTKLQLSDHKLEIESGRHIRPKINREYGTCKLCSKPDKQVPIEDEVHFITRCDNVMIICKRYYIKTLIKEWGLDNCSTPTGNATYTSCQMSSEDIVNTHDTFIKSL